MKNNKSNILTVIKIKTNIWNKAIKLLIKNKWELVYKYQGIDAGIDFDLVVLRKKDEEILFGWDNWEEGEIQANTEWIIFLESKLKTSFERGEPLNLKPKVVEIFWKN